MSDYVIERVVGQLRQLPEDMQRQVLSFAEMLRASIPAGVPGSDLLEFAGAIPADDLELIRQAIEDGCEQVNPDEW
jgi:hypothetical protein